MKQAVEYRMKAHKVDFDNININDSESAYNFAKQFFSDDIMIYESCFIILKGARRTIGFVKISQGGLERTFVDVRLIAKAAIDTLALGVILVHNHPSGNLRPSREDDSLTERVQSALNLFDIKLEDHLIITDEWYYSYHDEGRL